MSDFPNGSVWLVGAGPGDPELLTRKGERLIGMATTVFYDALVGPGILDLAAPAARLVHVGKRSGRHSKDQRTIDRLIAAGLPGDTPVALVESASLPDERVFRTRLDLLELTSKAALGDGPALLLIGAALAPEKPAVALPGSARAPTPAGAWR